jgi:hypothetical protein
MRCRLGRSWWGEEPMSGHQADPSPFDRHGLTVAEYAVMFHVLDTVVAHRGALAAHAQWNPPHVARGSLSIAECLAAVESCISRGWLEEFTSSRIATELERWRGEPLPKSFGVDLRWSPGDIDVTYPGHDWWVSHFPGWTARHPAHGYDDSGRPVSLDVFGETEAACLDQVQSLTKPLHFPSGYQEAKVVKIEPVISMGPWWWSRFERIDTGFMTRIHFHLQAANEP